MKQTEQRPKKVFRVSGQDVDLRVDSVKVVDDQVKVWIVSEGGVVGRLRKSAPNVFTDRDRAEECLEQYRADALRALVATKKQIEAKIREMKKIIGRSG